MAHPEPVDPEIPAHQPVYLREFLNYSQKPEVEDEALFNAKEMSGQDQQLEFLNLTAKVSTLSASFSCQFGHIEPLVRDHPRVQEKWLLTRGGRLRQ